MSGLEQFHKVYGEANYASPEFNAYQRWLGSEIEAITIESKKKLEVIELEKYGIVRFNSFIFEDDKESESHLSWFRRGLWIVNDLNKFFPLLEEALISQNIDIYARSLESVLKYTAEKMSFIAYDYEGELWMFGSTDDEVNFRIDAMTRLQEYATKFNQLWQWLITKYLWDFAAILERYRLK